MKALGFGSLFLPPDLAVVSFRLHYVQFVRIDTPPIPFGMSEKGAACSWGSLCFLVDVQGD